MLLALLPASAWTAEPRKLNVVFIMADDLGWADLGCYGSKYHQSPNLDALAKQSARFTNAYAGVHVCSPTRAAIMTGKWPARLGITDWLPGNGDKPTQKLLVAKLPNQLPASEKTIANHFKDNGYVTALVGKWHLGGEGAGPRERGFDVNIAGDHTGTALSYFAPYQNKQGRVMPGLENAPAGEYLTDRLTIEAEKFLDANRDKPFFLYMPHYNVHTPIKAKPDLAAKYKPGPQGSQGNPVYAAMIESLDESVGRILKKLDDLKIADRTLVIFTSDNGGLAALVNSDPPTSNAPLREGKGFLYEGGLRIPLIVRWPGVAKAGSVIDEPVCAVDFFSTLMEGCGFKDDQKRDGLSLVKLLKGETLGRDTLYWHYPHYHLGRPGGAIRHGDWKLIEFYDSGRRELYDLKKDPRESSNQAEAKPDVVKQLADKLDVWRKEVGATMMTPNPNYVPNPPDKDGKIVMHARTADVHGVNLRYEPAPHKVTLGYWTRVEDWASWEFTTLKPGEYTVEILQGCGKGQGGSEVNLAVGAQTLTFVVEDTGGFQSFKPRELGVIKLEKPGRYELTLKPTKKAAAAVMDVRSVTLKPK
jgi:arylsulfatase A-like enzyme